MGNIIMASNLERFITPYGSQPLVSHLAQGKTYLRHMSIMNSPSARRILTMVLKGLSLPPCGSVLEIGPGNCKYAVEFCLRGYDYQAYDVVPENQELWQILKEHYGLSGNVQLQDFCDVVVDGPRFHGIFALSTFEHIHDRERALQNCFKLLYPGGYLVVLDGNFLDPRLLWEMVIMRQIKTKGKNGGFGWLFNRDRIYENFGMGWKGKDEAVRSVWWWRREISKYGFFLIEAVTTGAYHPLVKHMPFRNLIGMVYIVAEKPLTNRGTESLIEKSIG